MSYFRKRPNRSRAFIYLLVTGLAALADDHHAIGVALICGAVLFEIITNSPED